MSLVTGQISRALTNCPITKKSFLGVFASDQLPDNPPRPSSMVVNLDPHTEQGSHWVGIYFPAAGQDVEYFDSYGKGPSVPDIVSYLHKYAINVHFNQNIVQAPLSAVCGHHTIHYILFRTLGYPMSQITGLFRSPQQFDNFVVALLGKYLRLPSELYDLHAPNQSNCFEQCCNKFEPG